MSESVQSSKISFESVLAEPAVKITVNCRPSGQLDLSLLITLARSCKCISFFCRRSLMKPHMSHYCIGERARGGLSPTLLKLKVWVIAGVEFSLGYLHTRYFHSPAGLERPSWSAMREAEFYNPPQHNPCCADLVPAFPNTQSLTEYLMRTQPQQH
jgi:hypothetical protein